MFSISGRKRSRNLISDSASRLGGGAQVSNSYHVFSKLHHCIVHVRVRLCEPVHASCAKKISGKK